MGRKILTLTLIAVFFALPALAEVETVKVGGELRFRGYLKHRTDLTTGQDQNDYLEQRTRVYVEADLTENVSTRIRFHNSRTWGSSDSTNFTIDEAYVTLKDVFTTAGLDLIPLDLQMGRQYFSYGGAFLLGGGTIRDSILATIDLDPWTVDLFTWKVDEQNNANDDEDVYGIYTTYSGIENWSIEPYFFARKDRDKTSSERRLTFALRADGDPIDNLDTWVEGAMQRGADINGDEIRGYAAWLGTKYTFADVSYKPFLNLEYVYGSGDKDATDDKNKAFDQSLDEDTGFGEVFSPSVSNIHIVKAGTGVEITDDLSLDLNYYHYEQDKKSSSQTTGLDSGTNPAGSKKDLGDEVDVILSYDYTEDVSTQLYWAYFDPGDAFTSTSNKSAYIVRGQMIVSF